MKKKIISAGHICLDITPVFPTGRSYAGIAELLEPGKLIHMEEADVHTGGSVANTGLALKILGADVKLMGKIGNDALGIIVQQIAAQYGGGGLLVDEDASTSYTVVLAVPGVDRIFLHNPGANDTFTNQDIPEEELGETVLFHFGYPPLMRSMYADDGKELLSIFKRMKEHGIATSLDLAAIDPDSGAGKADWLKILERVLPYTDFFVPSFEELCFILDRERYDELRKNGGDMTESLDLEWDARPLADRLLKMGCRVVLIKCGTSGMLYQTADSSSISQTGARLKLDPALWADRRGIQPCFAADQVLSGTGVGDTSIAAFLAAVLNGEDPAMCTALAAAEGACSVTTYDALSGLRPLDELKERIRTGWNAKVCHKSI